MLDRYTESVCEKSSQQLKGAARVPGGVRAMLTIVRFCVWGFEIGGSINEQERGLIARCTRDMATQQVQIGRKKGMQKEARGSDSKQRVGKVFERAC